MCRDKNHNPLIFFKELCHFVIFSLETYLLYNFQTLAVIFIKVGENIKTLSVDVQRIRIKTPFYFLMRVRRVR